MLPVWGENNRNAIAAGKTKTPDIHPVLIDREISRMQAKLDELNRAVGSGGEMTPEQKQQFIGLNKELKLLMDRRSQILTRTGDEYLTDPPKVAAK
jgi:low affinity Fe/Cu permease